MSTSGMLSQRASGLLRESGDARVYPLPSESFREPLEVHAHRLDGRAVHSAYLETLRSGRGHEVAAQVVTGRIDETEEPDEGGLEQGETFRANPQSPDAFRAAQPLLGGRRVEVDARSNRDPAESPRPTVRRRPE